MDFILLMMIHIINKFHEDTLTRIKVKKNKDGKFIVLATILTAVLFAALSDFYFIIMNQSHSFLLISFTAILLSVQIKLTAMEC